MDIDDIHLTK